MAGSGNDLGPCPYCGQHHAEKVLLCPNTEKLLPLEGRILDGKFRFVRLLGEGGMGAVWRAENVLVKKTVAIKLMHVQFSKDEGVLARFRNEATAAGRIGSDHICDILDLGRSDLGPYIVMEMLKGRDFATFLQQRQGRVDPGVSVLIVRESLKGLSAAHQSGIVHRDLKPENIFLHEPKPGLLMVKLMDFGISKFTEGSEAGKTGMGVLMGTPEYMSPEQTEGAAQVDHRTDIWAMGVILYWALSGRNPFLGPTMAATLVNVSTREPPPLQALGGQVAPGVIEVIARCLRKNPAERWQSCEELAAALAPFENRNNGIYAVEGEASSPSGPGRTVASMGSPTPPPGATMAAPGAMAIGTGPTMTGMGAGMGGGPGGMLGMPGHGQAPTFVGSVAPVGSNAGPTWTNEIKASSNSNSAPTLGGGFGLSEAQLDRRPDSSLGGGGSKGGIIVLVVVLIALLGGGGWFAFTQLGKGDTNGKVAATSETKADGGTPVETKSDDGKAAAESSGGTPVAVAGATVGDHGSTGGDEGTPVADAGTPAADAGTPDDGGKTPSTTTGVADDAGAADGGADGGGKTDDGGGKPDDGGGKPHNGGGKPHNGGGKPKVDTTKVDLVAGLYVPKPHMATASTFSEAKSTCAKHKQDQLGKLKGWRLASESEVAKIVGSGPKAIVWLANGDTYNTGIKRTNPEPGPRLPGARVLCVAKP